MVESCAMTKITVKLPVSMFPNHCIAAKERLSYMVFEIGMPGELVWDRTEIVKSEPSYNTCIKTQITTKQSETIP